MQTTHAHAPHVPASSIPDSRMTQMSDTDTKNKCPTYNGQLKPRLTHDSNVRYKQQMQMPTYTGRFKPRLPRDSNVRYRQQLQMPHICLPSKRQRGNSGTGLQNEKYFWNLGFHHLTCKKYEYRICKNLRCIF